MRDRYFSMYQSIQYKLCFYEVHSGNAYRKNMTCTIALVIISFIAATIWSAAKLNPVVCALIIGLAQLAQAFSPIFPWNKQLISCKFLIPAATRLVRQIDADWLSLDLEKYNDEKIKELIAQYDRQWDDLEDQFVGDTYFSEKQTIKDAAEAKSRNYFYQMYPSIKEQETEAFDHAK